MSGRNFTLRELEVLTRSAVVKLVLDRVSFEEDGELIDRIAHAEVDLIALEKEFLGTNHVKNIRNHAVPRGRVILS